MDIRRLTDADLPVVTVLLDSDPIAAAMLSARLHMAGVSRSGGDLWGTFHQGRLLALAHSGATLTVSSPADDTAIATAGEAVAALGTLLHRFPRRCVSIIGPSRLVAHLWPPLAPVWGPPRDVRPQQPLLLARGQASVDPAGHRAVPPTVTFATPEDVGALYQPSLDMFTEEVGVSPLHGSSEQAYWNRLALMVSQQRVLIAKDAHGVVFKAEIAAVTPHTCHIQGVWVRPNLRGRGIGTRAMVQTVAIARRFAPSVSLYVNDYNIPALRAYAHAGFHQVGTMATIHF